jgi:hypothetical protein
LKREKNERPTPRGTSTQLGMIMNCGPPVIGIPLSFGMVTSPMPSGQVPPMG